MTDIASYRAIIVRAFPDLAHSAFSLLKPGWHSTAVDVDGRLVFKFPRGGDAENALRREAAFLAIVRPRVTMTVPDLTLREGPPLFSRHGKLRGEHLDTADYAKLSESARQRFGEELGRFYAELHRLDIDQMHQAGARPIQSWQTPDTIRTKALPKLKPELKTWASETLDAFEALPPDPHGMTYGFFDGHGWNMAFDHAAQKLNGLYDFADSGFGPVHQEFIYSNFISSDLTARIVSAYEGFSGRQLDRRRIAVLTGTHRLSELAELADDPEHAPMMVEHVRAWVERDGS